VNLNQVFQLVNCVLITIIWWSFKPCWHLTRDSIWLGGCYFIV